MATIIKNIDQIRNEEFDFVIIGSGLIGTTCALLIEKSLKDSKVLIIEQGSKNKTKPANLKKIHQIHQFKNNSLNYGFGGNSSSWGGLLSIANQQHYDYENLKNFDDYEDLIEAYEKVGQLFNFPLVEDFKSSPQHHLTDLLSKKNSDLH